MEKVKEEWPGVEGTHGKGSGGMGDMLPINPHLE